MALFAFGALWAVLMGAPVYLSRILLVYLVLLPAHLSISYSNDYFDIDVDKYDKPTLFSGGSGVLVDHPELRKPAKWTAITLILCSLALGIVFQILYSFPIWFLGIVLLGNLLGWFYSAPPLRFAYRGLGELSMAVSIGLLIRFGYLVTSGQINMDGLLFIIPLMLYGLAFILNVEIPDMESDFGQQVDMGSSKGARLWLHCDRSIIPFGNIILLLFSMANLPLLSIGIPYSGYPIFNTSCSRLHWSDRRAVDK
jgi:1,4-dihydroxy-2-naphthoate octaprenyltransferase